jgi:carbon monoxide dehydrogenase subunit G
MAIKFGGEFEVQRNREEVYDFLTDPNKFGPLLPDFQSISVQDPTHFMVKVSVGVSHIRGIAEVKLTLEEAQRPSRAKYRGQGIVPGGNASVTASFDLSETSIGTKVAWNGEAQIFGKLISVAGGLLEPLGRKNIQKLIDALQAALKSAAAQSVATPQTADQTVETPKGAA